MEYFVKKKVDVFVNLPTGNGKSLIYPQAEHPMCLWFKRIYEDYE